MNDPFGASPLACKLVTPLSTDVMKATQPNPLLTLPLIRPGCRPSGVLPPMWGSDTKMEPWWKLEKSKLRQVASNKNQRFYSVAVITSDSDIHQNIPTTPVRIRVRPFFCASFEGGVRRSLFLAGRWRVWRRWWGVRGNSELR